MTPRHCLIFLCGLLLCCCRSDFSSMHHSSIPIDRAALIKPERSGTVIPPNIAPLNFKISEKGTSYRTEISSTSGSPIIISSPTPSIRIPFKKWKKLLDQNRGGKLRITIYVRETGGQWHSFKPIEDTIAAEVIDPFITYRCLSFLYNYSTDLRMYQRDLESFREKQLMSTLNFAWGCCNCHSPKNNDPRNFLVHVRSEDFGSNMLLSINGELSKIGSRFGYPAWHPDGGVIVFSIYKVQQCFHAVGHNFIDVYDNNSDIVVYDIKKENVRIVPELHQKQTLETWPCWTPDGRYLYFCSAPILWTNFNKTPPDNFEKIRYSLLRIAYNAPDDTWGDIDTVLSPRQTKLSISQPRISPDGRFLLFCMHEYGGYPHTQKSSDLYMMELSSGKYFRLDLNSEYAEMWHGWSNNSRWILFSSKRNGGIFTRVYFCYVDSAGNVHSPFIMPQKDPAFYDSFIKSYNVPEFALGPVPFSERKILNVLRSSAKVNAQLPVESEGIQTGSAAWEKLPSQ